MKTRTIAILLASMASIMAGSVYTSKSYAQSHPLDGMHLRMMYCIDMQRYENKPMEDVGCKVGQGLGKRGVKEVIIQAMVERMNIYKDSYEYRQLTSKKGLHMMFHDPALGSKGQAIVWQDEDGRLSYDIERDE